jgi:hypothetical protein
VKGKDAGAPQCLFQFRRFALYMLTQGFVDEGLIACRSARCLGLMQKVIHQVFVEANRDARLAARLRFRWGNPSAPALAEIVSLLHRMHKSCVIGCSMENPKSNRRSPSTSLRAGFRFPSLRCGRSG